MPERQTQASDSVLTGVRYIHQKSHDETPQLVCNVCSLRFLLESFQNSNWLLTTAGTYLGSKA